VSKLLKRLVDSYDTRPGVWLILQQLSRAACSSKCNIFHIVCSSLSADTQASYLLQCVVGRECYASEFVILIIATKRTTASVARLTAQNISCDYYIQSTLHVASFYSITFRSRIVTWKCLEKVETAKTK